MRKLSPSKMLATVVGVSAAFAVLTPAATATASTTTASSSVSSSGCKDKWSKLNTKDGFVSYVLKLCSNGYGEARGSVTDTKSDAWTTVVEVSFKKSNGDEIYGEYKEAGRKKGQKSFKWSTSRTNLDRITIRAKRCLPSTIVCNNTKTYTLYP
ncbi:hypothetical protein AB0C18_05780 [Nonomuraea muscovyensis]|uniref:Secreted protein n=1 Tax=Nonomuraea muscovyensis TaxID=1124761 RepID=A0A7X0C989_9ACTN|nr:hypothetical protein [Nonomuraea muscovyensis]MBB6349830.1 hypothetical protein [Nonomuraea muscovyensis]MDF2707223.1 hypothetical protein [Nonomuraea muscovyensis]